MRFSYHIRKDSSSQIAFEALLQTDVFRPLHTRNIPRHHNPICARSVYFSIAFYLREQYFAEGYLYLDDEHSLAHESGFYALRSFSFQASADTAEIKSTSGDRSDRVGYTAPNTVERVVIAGQARAPKGVRVSATPDSPAVDLEWFYDSQRMVITIKKPNVKVSDDWALSLYF